jgi:hypothetical protein
MEIHATQPKKDDRELAEMGKCWLLFKPKIVKVTRVETQLSDCRQKQNKDKSPTKRKPS